MDEAKTPELRLVVSGGAALIATGIINRSTIDIDVFAQRELEGDLIPGNPLPEWFTRLTSRVAEIEKLPRKWINADTSLVMNGLEMLPAECFRDLHEEDFGTRLRVCFLRGKAQIYLKAYAICGRDEPRDSEDFRALHPTADDVTRCIEWMIQNELIGRPAATLAVEKLNRALNEQQ